MSHKFTTPRLLIANYYDDLVNKIDIYTEKALEKYTDEDLIPTQYYYNLEETSDEEKVRKGDYDDFCGEEYNHKDPYSTEYTYENVENDEDVDAQPQPGVAKMRDYINRAREKAIGEILKVQKHNLDQYDELNFKIDRDHMDENKLEELKARLFENKFAFVLFNHLFDKYNYGKIKEIFEMHTIITDFYFSQEDIGKIKFVKEKFEIDEFNEQNLFVFLVNKYISGLIRRYKCNNKVIEIKKSSILNIEKIYNSYNKYPINCNIETNRFDLTAIKSICIDYKSQNNIELVCLSAFSNLEYLTLRELRLNKSSLNGLNRLKYLSMSWCNLSELDSDSFQCLGNLVVLKIDKVKSPIDLKHLVRLECLMINMFDNIRLVKNLNGNDLSRLDLTRSPLDHKAANRFFNENKFPNLVGLNLFQNKLSEFDKQWFLNLPTLKFLVLSFNKINDLRFLNCEQFSNLQFLDLSYNQIECIKADAFSKLTNLKRLFLERNICNDRFTLEANCFRGLGSLEELNLGLNNIQSIGKDVFSGLGNLIDLKLEKAELRNFEIDTFVHTPKLAKLDLSRNSICIKTIDLLPLKHLQSLRLFSTPFDISAHLDEEVWTYLSKLNVKIERRSKEEIENNRIDFEFSNLYKNHFEYLRRT